MSKLLTLSLLLAGNLSAADDVVVRAMKDEMARSMKKLQLENLQKPYFISYRVIDSEFCVASASFGAIVASACDRGGESRPSNRRYSVEVRVGDYDRDNSNYYAMRQSSSGVVVFSSDGQDMPIEEDYDEFRRQLWLATDGAYKVALDNYAQKKAALENRTRTDVAADFSKEPPVTDAETAPWTRPTKEQLESTVRPLSLLFRQTPDIDHSEVRIQISNWLTRYVNSEGTSFSRQNSAVNLAAIADTQAADGMPVTDFEAFYGRSFDDLPSKDDLVKRIHELQARMTELRKAPLLEKYTGPVLFEGQAAAELVAQGLGPGIVGSPRVVVDDVRFEGIFGRQSGLAEKIGGRVLPDFLSLKDDPTAREFGGKPLLAGYQVDEDGVKARPTPIVEKGILKTLLHTRGLIAGTTASTANKRGPAPAPTNLLLTSEKGMPADQLKAELLRLVKQRGKEYGVLVRRMANPSLAPTLGRNRTVIVTNGGAEGLNLEPLTMAYKVYPDGHEELARNLRIQRMQLNAFKEILAVSDQPAVYTAPYQARLSGPMMMGTFYAPALPAIVSIVTPSLLFDELTLQRPSGEVPNLPFTRHPYFEGK